jgi:hypothetical protein
LISTEWELAHPLSMVMALPRAISDHTPLLVDTGQSSLSKNIPMFNFELGWFLRDGFMDMVREVLNNVYDREDKMRCWQLKIRRLHQHLRGWMKHTSGVNRKEKKRK